MAKVPPSPFNPAAAAGSVVQPCPLAKQGGSATGTSSNGQLIPLTREMRDQLLPCDVKSVTLALKGPKGSINVTGTSKSASATPIAGADPEINKLLAAHSVVIVEIVPANTMSEKVGSGNGQSRTSELTITKGKAKADVFFSVKMKAQCGTHPEFKRTPALKSDDKDDTDVRARELSVGTQEWTAQQFFKAIGGGVKFSDFVFGQQDTAVFCVDSCGRPAAGDATTSLTGYARIALADEWQAEFAWARGFKLEFNESSEFGRDLKDGSRMRSSSSKIESSIEQFESENSNTEVRNKAGQRLYSETESEGNDPEYKYTKGRSKGSIEAQASWTSRKERKDVADAFKEQGDSLKDLTKDGTISVKLTRNGTSLVDSGNLSKILEDLQETLETGLDLVNRLALLLQTGVKAGIPVTVTFGLEASLVLLKGQFRARFWAEMAAPHQAGTYYIAGHRRRFQVGVSLTIIELSMTPSFTLEAKVLHKWVGSISLTIEAKIGGSAKVDFSVTDATGAADFKAVGTIPMSVKGSGEASAISMYFLVEGEATSCITYVWTLGYDSDCFTWQKNKVRSEELTLTASCRFGNKIWDLFGFGSDDPYWQWPKDPPFVWLEQDAISKSW